MRGPLLREGQRKGRVIFHRQGRRSLGLIITRRRDQIERLWPGDTQMVTDRDVAACRIITETEVSGTTAAGSTTRTTAAGTTTRTTTLSQQHQLTHAVQKRYTVQYTDPVSYVTLLLLLPLLVFTFFES